MSPEPLHSPQHRDSPMLLFLRMGTGRFSRACLAPWPPWALRLVSKGSSAPTGKRGDANRLPTPGPLGPATAAHPTALLVTEGVPLYPQGGASRRVQDETPNAAGTRLLPALHPTVKLQASGEGPAASPPGAPPQGSWMRADPGEVPEASPPCPQG